MICEFNFTLGVPDCGASRYRAALRILICILSRCQIVLLRVLLLIRLLLTFHHYTLDLSPQGRWGRTIVLCLGRPNFQPNWCFDLLFSLSGVDFPCSNGADKLMAGILFTLVRDYRCLIESSEPFKLRLKEFPVFYSLEYPSNILIIRSIIGSRGHLLKVS
jgi:hypothetical protein